MKQLQEKDKAEHATAIRQATEPAAEVVPMARWRMFGVTMLIAAILGGSIFDYARDLEHWPFSQYPMYCTVKKEHACSQMRVFGIVGSSAQDEFPLVESKYIYPFNPARLDGALQHLADEKASNAVWNIALNDLLSRYEMRRRRHDYDGPELQGIRLKALTWSLDPEGRNLGDPDRQELIHEVVLNLDMQADSP